MTAYIPYFQSLIILLFPFIPLSPYPLPLYYFQTIALLALCFTCFSQLIIAKVKFIFVEIGILGVLAFCLQLIIATVVGIDPINSLLGNAERSDSLPVSLCFCLMAIMMPKLYSKDQHRLLNLFTQSAVLVSLCLLYYHYFGAAFFTTKNLLLNNSFLLTGYLVITTPLFFYSYYLSKGFTRVYYFIILLLQVFHAVYTDSVVSLGLIGLVAFWWQVKSAKVMIVTSIISLIFFTAVVFVKSPAYSPESRSRLWQRSLLAIKSKPLFGYGSANVGTAIYIHPYPIVYDYDLNFDKAHSTVLEIALTAGIPGLFIYLSLILLAVSRLIKNLTPANFLSLSILLIGFIHAQTNVISLEEEIIWWIALGKGLKPIVVPT